MAFDERALAFGADGSREEVLAGLGDVEAYDKRSERRQAPLSWAQKGVMVVGVAVLMLATELGEAVLGPALGLVAILLGFGIVGAALLMKRHKGSIVGHDLVDARYRFLQELLPALELKPGAPLGVELHVGASAQDWLTLRGRDADGNDFSLAAHGKVGAPTQVALTLRAHMTDDREVRLEAKGSGASLCEATLALLDAARKQLSDAST